MGELLTLANDDSGYPLKREVELGMDPHGLVRRAQFVHLVGQARELQVVPRPAGFMRAF